MSAACAPVVEDGFVYVRMFPEGIAHTPWAYGSIMGASVYGLTDPAGAVRYVGMTRGAVRHRYQSHVFPPTWDQRSPKAKWIESMRPEWPGVVILEEVRADDGSAAELRWIDLHCTGDANCPLTNVNGHTTLHAGSNVVALPRPCPGCPERSAA